MTTTTKQEALRELASRLAGWQTLPVATKPCEGQKALAGMEEIRSKGQCGRREFEDRKRGQVFLF